MVCVLKSIQKAGFPAAAERANVWKSMNFLSALKWWHLVESTAVSEQTTTTLYEAKAVICLVTNHREPHQTLHADLFQLTVCVWWQQRAAVFIKLAAVKSPNTTCPAQSSRRTQAGSEERRMFLEPLEKKPVLPSAPKMCPFVFLLSSSSLCAHWQTVMLFIFHHLLSPNNHLLRYVHSFFFYFWLHCRPQNCFKLTWIYI